MALVQVQERGSNLIYRGNWDSFIMVEFEVQ